MIPSEPSDVLREVWLLVKCILAAYGLLIVVGVILALFVIGDDIQRWLRNRGDDND
jgi:prolipoprotein diacylglyceryltransferase